MSVTAPAQPIAPESAPSPSGHKEDLREKHAHAGVAMAIATFAMAAASGIQAVLYLSSFGIGGRTDGFFVAFALYTSFGVFSQSIRVTSAPLLVGDRPRLAAGEFALVLVAIAVPVAIATIPLAGPLAGAAGTGPRRGRPRGHRIGPADPRRGDDPAALGRRRRDPAGRPRPLRSHRRRLHRRRGRRPGRLRRGLRRRRRALARLVDAGDGGRHLRRDARRRPRSASGSCQRPSASIAALAGSSAASGCVLGRTFVYLAFNGLYVVTLAFASNYGAGDATVLSYAYLFASYLVAAPASRSACRASPTCARGALADWREVIADTVPPGFRYAMLLVAPALAALIAGGATLIGEVLPGQLRRRAGRSAADLRGAALRLDGGGAAGQPAAAGAVRARTGPAGQPAGAAGGRPPHRRHRARRRPVRRRRASSGRSSSSRSIFAVVLLAASAPGAAAARSPASSPATGCASPVFAAACFGIGAAIGDGVGTGVAAPLLTVGIGSVLYALVAAMRLAPRPGAAAASAPCDPPRHERRRSHRRPGQPARSRRGAQPVAGASTAERRRSRGRRPARFSSPCWRR